MRRLPDRVQEQGWTATFARYEPSAHGGALGTAKGERDWLLRSADHQPGRSGSSHQNGARSCCSCAARIPAGEQVRFWPNFASIQYPQASRWSVVSRPCSHTKRWPAGTCVRRITGRLRCWRACPARCGMPVSPSQARSGAASRQNRRVIRNLTFRLRLRCIMIV